MPANVEIKARLADIERARSLAAAISGSDGELIEQVDVFFAVERGRLKLRALAPDRGELIAYHRVDRAGPKRSEYRIYPTTEPEALRVTLGSALPVVGEVRKRRHLFLLGQARIHLDEVEGLGHFLELEIVLRPDQSTADGNRIAEVLMRKLGIASADLIEGAYMDLLLQRSPTPPRP